MVDSVEGEGTPPPELVLAFMCQKWNTLPDAGGLYDQDARIMKKMSGVLAVHNAISRWRSLTGRNIHQLTESERRILRTLKDMRLLLN